jgi:hypothetical protein
MILGVDSIKCLDELMGELVQQLLTVRSQPIHFFLPLSRGRNGNESLLLETRQERIDRARSEGRRAVLGQILDQPIPVTLFLGEEPKDLELEHAHLRYIDRHTMPS